MGHTSIPLASLQVNTKNDKWYTLLPKPGHIAQLDVLLERYKKKRGAAGAKMTKAKIFALSLQTADLEASMAVKVKKPHKLVDIKLNSLSYCGHCSGIMWSMTQ